MGKLFVHALGYPEVYSGRPADQKETTALIALDPLSAGRLTVCVAQRWLRGQR